MDHKVSASLDTPHSNWFGTGRLANATKLDHVSSFSSALRRRTLLLLCTTATQSWNVQPAAAVQMLSRDWHVTSVVLYLTSLWV